MAKAKKSDVKKSTSIALTDETRALAELIMRKYDRSLSWLSEKWIRQEAEELGMQVVDAPKGYIGIAWNGNKLHLPIGTWEPKASGE